MLNVDSWQNVDEKQTAEESFFEEIIAESKKRGKEFAEDPMFISHSVEFFK